MQDASSSSTGSKAFEVATVAFLLSIGGAIASLTPMFVMLSAVFETERSVAVHRVSAVNFTIVYAASIIILAQIVVIALRVKKKKLRKTTLQAMEFVYLGFGAVGILTIVSLLSELDSERALQAEAFANMRLASAEVMLDRGQQSCRDYPPEVAEKAIVRRACEWLNKADAFFDGAKTKRAWAKIKDEHSAILADGRRELMTTMLVDPISHKPTQYMFGYGFEMIGVWVEHYLDNMALSRRFKTDLANIHNLGTSWSDPSSEYSWQIQFFRLAAPFALAFALSLRLSKLTAETIGAVETESAHKAAAPLAAESA